MSEVAKSEDRHKDEECQLCKIADNLCSSLATPEQQEKCRQLVDKVKSGELSGQAGAKQLMEVVPKAVFRQKIAEVLKQHADSES